MTAERRILLQTFCKAAKRVAAAPSVPIRRFKSTQPLLFPDAFIHRRGDHPYGSREYLLVQPAPSEEQNDKSRVTGPDGRQLQILASLNAHRNIVFGAAVKVEQSTLLDLCPPLLRASLEDCSADGEQPQAVSTLHGLSAWVRACLQGESSSTALELLRCENETVVLQAVTAIATGIPRPGHSVVGQGTYRDGATGWEALAKEFVLTQTISEECQLYQSSGAELVQIELLADTNPAYLASAGGAMARFFFM
jgi:hypothetical protein